MDCNKTIFTLFSLSLCCFSMLSAEELRAEDQEVADASHAFFIDRAEAIPDKKMRENNTDHYLEGYIQALLDMHYYEHQVIVLVDQGVVYLYNLPNNALLSNSIIQFVQDLPCVEEVEVKCELTPEECERRKSYVEQPYSSGIWFPQSTVLFLPLIASPREVVNSIAYRSGDRVVGKTCIAISIGDNFPIYRWTNVFKWCGDLQIGIEACIWAPFNFHHVPRMGGTKCELFNTDYLLGIPLDYAVDKWSFRLEVYHISSHLGDEFLFNRPQFLPKRKNPSFEVLEFFTSYQATRWLRLYFGPAYIFHSDQTYNMDNWYLEYGLEARFLATRFCYHRIYGTFFFAVDVQNWQIRDWNFDWSVKGGYEISKLAGVGRKMRLFASYHHGYSYEGQFFKKRTKYAEYGFSWGF